ncbi:MAG: hypothetical protein ACYC2X_02915 [Coriobacteriia bacterium]
MTEHTPGAPAPERPVDRWTVAEAVPDTVVSIPTPRTQVEARSRRDFRARVGAAGATLGFEVGAEGTWRSTTGVTISTRMSERSITPAAAVHFVTQIAATAAAECERCAVLFVVAYPETAESFTVAIRHRGAFDRVRAITIDDLEMLAVLGEAGRVTHGETVSLLAPVAGIDAGGLVSALARACARGDE